MVYTQLFHSKIGNLKVLIDMQHVQAIAEQSNDAVQIITANDTYTVAESFEFVEQSWQDSLTYLSAQEDKTP